VRDGGVPFSARKVAPPAHIDWPPISLLMKKCSAHHGYRHDGQIW